jgi:hypothetical protein
VASVNGKTSDLCYVTIQDVEKDGYVPSDMNIGGGDYLEFDYCLDCGQMIGEFPILYPTKLEQKYS